MRITGAHASGRFDRDIDLLRAEIKMVHRLASFAVHTELSSDKRARKAFPTDPNWSYYRSPEERGADECIIEWDNDVWSLVGGALSVPITEMTFTRSREYGGQEAPPIHCQTVVLGLVDAPRKPPLIVSAAHMSLDNTERRAEVWKDSCKGWKRHIRDMRREFPGAKTWLSADWNKNYREAAERGAMETYIAEPLGLVQAWEGHAPEHGGTHGPRGLIDGVMTDLRVRDAYLLPDSAASDHRPCAVDAVL